MNKEPVKPKRARSTERVCSLKLPASDFALLRAAAKEANCSINEYIVQSALFKAEEVLADRRVFRLDHKQWNEFQRALNAPTRPMPRMKRLLQTPGYFDNSSDK